jgi:pimeloyl-ACP methyl ester carboxylesterase
MPCTLERPGRVQLRDIGAALVVGNSFGATLAYLLAAQYPQRCRGLVMVDGFPPPEVPGPLRWLMRGRLLRLGALAHMRRHIYGPKALRKGFCDPARAPAEVKRALEQPEQSRIEHMLEIVLDSRRVSVTPQQPILIVWGADDHLPNAELAVGRRLHHDLPGSRFEVIEQAGHMPQVEQPDRFVRVLRAFIELPQAGAPVRGGAA